MKTIAALLLALVLALAFHGTATAGDPLPGGKSYSLLNKDGSDAGHVTTGSNGSKITYHPGNGDPSIEYEWVNPPGRYENAGRGDYFVFYLWPSKSWEHDYIEGSPQSGSGGTYTENPDKIVKD